MTTNTVSEPAPGILKTLGNRAAALPTAYAVLAALPVFLVSSQSVILQRELSFDRVQLGVAISVSYAASAVTALPIGRLLQHASPSLGLRMAAVLSMTSLVLVGAVASQWWHLLVAMALCGAANASAQVASNLALAGGVARSRQALAFGARQAAIPFASVLAGLSVPVVAALFGWRGDMLGAAVVVAATLLLAPRLASARPSGPKQGMRVDRYLIALGVSGICAGAIGNSLPAFTVDAATTAGIGHNGASLLLALGGLAAVAGRLSAGMIADRRRSVGIAELMATTLIGAAAFSVLAVGHDTHAVFVIAMLVAFAGGWGWAGAIHFATMRSSAVGAGTASGFVLAWIYTGNLIGPVAMGATVEATSYSLAWLVSAVVLVGSAVAAAVARRMRLC